MKYMFCWRVGFIRRNGRYLPTFENSQEKEFEDNNTAIKLAQSLCTSLVYTVSEDSDKKVAKVIYSNRVLGPGEKDRIEDDITTVLNLKE